MLESKKNRWFQLNIEKPRNLKNDILSGLTVALALIPEAVAFSFVAHVDPIVGLYAAFMMGLITAVIGGRPGMISGATGAVAVIFAPLMIGQIELHGQQDALAYLFSAVILMGILQILFGVCKLGKFIRMVPYPVKLGFANGLAIVIFKSQFEQFYAGHGAAKHLLDTPALLVMAAMILLTMAISHFLPKLTKAVPATLVAIVSVTAIAYFLDKSGTFHARNVLDFVQNDSPATTTIAASLPTFGIPKIPFTLDTFLIILPYSALAAAVGLIESLMTLSLIDEITETRGKGNKECIGQGVANFVTGLFGGMGGCAMIGQSMINIRGGGRGRTSGIAAALFLLGFVIFAAPLVEIVPLAALVGVMFMVVIATFEWSSIRIMPFIPRSDAIVVIIVSAITVILDLATAVLIGCIFSALVFAWNQGKVMHAQIDASNEKIKIYKLKGALFFGSATSFARLFDVQNDPDEVVIDFAESRVYDHSGIEAINSITEKYASYDKKLHLLNLSKECTNLLNKADNIIEISLIEDLDWHIADNALD